MVLPLSLIIDEFQDNHQFRVYSLDTDNVCLEALASTYRELRTECDYPLEDISLDGIVALNVESIRKRLLKAAVPMINWHPNPSFDVVRSDFGETLSYLILQEQYKTEFGYKSIRDREVIQLTGRGIDAVGIEEEGILTLVLGEVKVSNDKSSPPSVVDKSNDCLREQHLNHISDMENTAKKIWDLSRRARVPRLQKLFQAAAFLLEEGMLDKLNLVVCSVLVRPKELFQKTDFGSFQSSPIDYDPARVRFLIICIPDDVSTCVTNWYELVKQASEEK